MKITLIRPNMFNTISKDAMQPLAIAVLASLIPKDIEVEFFDDRIENLPDRFETDLVAISVETFTARRAYQIATQIRKMGIPVVLGGIHISAMPDEALNYCDGVVIGEAEGLWEELVEDFKRGALKRVYNSEDKPSLHNIKFDRDIFKDKKYTPIIPVQFGRGCKNSCEFCSVHAFFGKDIRYRPIKDVVSEIKSLNTRNIFFVDDNIFIEEGITEELLEALIPLNIKWTSQASIDIVKNPKLLKLMEKSGCISLIIGFESMDKRNLKLMKKGVNLANDYDYAIKKLEDHGIMVYGTFIIGYDFDTMDTFQTIYDFAIKHNLMLANFNPLIPMPGTKLYDRFQLEDRFLYEKWWLDPEYRYGKTVYKPEGLTPEQLEEGCYKIRVDFNKYSSIIGRLIKSKSNHKGIINSTVFIGANLISKKEISQKQNAVLGDDSIDLSLEGERDEAYTYKA